MNNLQHVHTTKLIFEDLKHLLMNIHEYAYELQCNYGDL